MRIFHFSGFIPHSKDFRIAITLWNSYKRGEIHVWINQTGGLLFIILKMAKKVVWKKPFVRYIDGVWNKIAIFLRHYWWFKVAESLGIKCYINNVLHKVKVHGNPVNDKEMDWQFSVVMFIKQLQNIAKTQRYIYYRKLLSADINGMVSLCKVKYIYFS